MPCFRSCPFSAALRCVTKPSLSCVAQIPDPPLLVSGHRGPQCLLPGTVVGVELPPCEGSGVHSVTTDVTGTDLRGDVFLTGFQQQHQIQHQWGPDSYSSASWTWWPCEWLTCAPYLPWSQYICGGTCFHNQHHAWHQWAQDPHHCASWTWWPLEWHPYTRYPVC